MSVVEAQLLHAQTAVFPIKPSWYPRIRLSALCLLSVQEDCDRKGEVEWPG